jgi:hypothetical protein
MAIYSKRTRKQEALIAALLTEENHAAAALKAGVGAQTLHRWLKLPDFQAAYREARRRVVDDAVATMQANSGKAAATILAVATNSVKDADRVRAAKALLDFAFRGLTQVDALCGPAASNGEPMDPNDMVGLQAERIRQLDNLDMPVSEKARLTVTLADALLRAVGVAGLSKQLESLQIVLKDRKEKK